MDQRRVSMVVPVWNVARYLPEFLDGLQAQGEALDEVEVVFVDDGSTDGSGEILDEWAGTRAPHVRVIHQPNLGVSEARNTGLRAASGEWITFPDPDDRLTPGYLDVVLQRLRTIDDDCTMLVTRLLLHHEVDGRVVDEHPLRFRFARGNRTVDPATSPDFIHVSASTAFLRTDLVVRHALTFDPRVVPHFEDGHLLARYRVVAPGPVELVADATYEYRLRADGSSLLQTSLDDPRRFVDVPRHGFLHALMFARDHLGHVPEWLQNTVIYDVMWYFRRDASIGSPSLAMDPGLLAEYRETLREIFALIDPDVVWAFKLSYLSPSIRAMMVALTGVPVRPWGLFVSELDDRRQLARITYSFTGELVERFRLDDRPIAPTYAHTRGVVAFCAPMLQERTVWVPAHGQLTATLDDQRLPLWLGDEARQPLIMRREAMWRYWRGIDRHETELGPQGRPGVRPPGVVGAGDVVPPRRRRPRSGARDWLIRRFATTWPVRRRFRGAWALMDRDTDANDNAEHLYRWLRKKKPEVNAWFVLNRDSPHWGRLESEGFRLVEHGSTRHVLLLRNADHLVSSHLDAYVVDPFDRERLGPTDWRFTFLQHGVTKDDQSRWFNDKDISLLVTTTRAERDSVVRDGSPYALTTREVRLTGMPRHDALLRKAAAVDVADRDLILVMPTWRKALMTQASGGNARQLAPEYGGSRYHEAWAGLLRSGELARLAEEGGLTLAFMPHPTMLGMAEQMPDTSHVRMLSHASDDVQDVLSRAALVISDYSSIVFEAALLDRAVIHYQFDREEIAAGTHVYGPGYFDYERDGFGPVVTTGPEVVGAVRSFLQAGGRPAEPYASRMAATMERRDGKSCARVYQAIAAMDRPMAARRLL